MVDANIDLLSQEIIVPHSLVLLDHHSCSYGNSGADFCIMGESWVMVEPK